MRLFSNHRWRKNVVRTKKWHTRRSRVCHWCSYRILTSSVIYYWVSRTATWNLFILYNNEKPFLWQNISTQRENRPFARPLPRLCTKKSHLTWSDLNKMKQFHWLLCANRATVKPDSSVAPRWMKTYSERRIELRNLQILKKMLEKSSQFLSSEQPCEPKSLDVALKITEVEKIPSENLWLRSRRVDLEAIWFEFWMKGA